MATKLRNTSKAKNTSNKPKTSKNTTRKNGSGVSQKDIYKANQRLQHIIDKDPDSLGYIHNVREQQRYVNSLENRRKEKLEMNEKQYQNYATQIKDGKMVKIPLRQRFNPYSTHSRRLNQLYHSQHPNRRHGGKTKKRPTKKTTKKVKTHNKSHKIK